MQKKKSGFNHLFTETRLGWLLIFMIAAYVGMGLIAYALKGNFKFFQGSTLQTMCCQIPEIGILAIAVMLPMITGGIDLSMVGKANLSGIVAAAFMTAWTRTPRPPTKVPTGSTPGTVLVTAILVRRPASLAIPLISTVPLSISGTSWRNKHSINSAEPRDKMSCAPLSLFSMFLT